jgi:hypothetical protein
VVRWPWKRTAEEPPAFPTTAAPGEPEQFVDSAREFFAAAWAEDADDRGIEAFAVQTEEERRSEEELSRQLSRRPRGAVIALVAVAAAGGVLAFGVTQGWFEADPSPEDAGVVFEAAIAAPQDPRSYIGDPMPGSPSAVGVLDRGFRASDSGSELVDPVPDDLPAGVEFTPILWGNRLQVLVTGPADMMADACLVVALVADDLRALDVAARGECADIHRITGDRSSCSADGIELVEVWPPIARTDLLEEPEAVERIRVRIERRGLEAGERRSVRGELDLRGAELLDLPVVAGEPGTVLDTTFGIAPRSCTLLDRSDVEIRVV